MKYFFIFIFLLSTPFCKAQYNNDIWVAGSANTLKGKTFILSIFISTKETKWDTAEKKKFLAMQTEAENWLITQAKNYKTEISFQDSCYGLQKDLVLNEIETGTASGNERVDWVSYLFEKIAYNTPLEFYNWVKKNTNCKNAIVVIYANQKGNSYAFPMSNQMSQEKYFTEGCMMYRQYNSGQDLCSAAIAHEILHLFAGWDLYTTYVQTKDREDRARRIYPDDIMLRVSYSINELKIDKLTAWRVGLSKETDDIFEWFRPKDMPKY